ncbi:hypothetical protein [Corynebacterium pseudogenitalium]|uniref:Uncharacterized protein n=1 Tax=Corynebacterium pseudogenitalium ATCC 33035 TaxID=525264 RepID=E2S5Q9_9CORY|nr:hypothetical protein [Corynebacterium pseudogenitalium]EFQ79920.1 hypothetical protein HMPREF0305_11800 [Corynebacterium pseudogenitalium ATCC 33035]
MKRYANGKTQEEQARHNQNYRRKQKQARTWIADIAKALGEPKEDVVKIDAVRVAALIREGFTESERPGNSN